MKRTISVFSLAACLAAAAWGDDAKTAAVPVLVELFTAEGCSSCPPADEWLLQMDKVQPLAGAQLIVLSEHVTYWDQDGWKDPYSSPLITERQTDYAHGFRIDSPYTPQVVVNGTVNLKLSDSKHVRQTFEQAAKAMTLPVTITGIIIDPANPAILHAHVQVDGSSAGHNADIYEAVALDHAESQVLHGENGGKHLSHVAVVQQLSKVGKMEKGKTFTRDIDLKLKPGADPKNTRLVIFVQEGGPGKVLGAALHDPIS